MRPVFRSQPQADARPRPPPEDRPGQNQKGAQGRRESGRPGAQEKAREENEGGRMTTRPSREVVDELCKVLTDKGQLIEAGWRSYELIVLDPNASDIQLKETRIAFFAGAQHLWGSVMGILDPGAEPTDKDMARM